MIETMEFGRNMRNRVDNLEEYIFFYIIDKNNKFKTHSREEEHPMKYGGKFLFDWN